MSSFWFGRLVAVGQNHLTATRAEEVVSAPDRPLVQGRAVVVKKLKPILIEAVVRGVPRRQRLAGVGVSDRRIGVRRVVATGPQTG